MFTEIQGSLCLLSCQQGAVRRMRTRIELLAQPGSMRSIIGATQRKQRHGSAYNWCVSKGSVIAASQPTEPPHLNWSTVIFKEQRIENDKQTTKARRDCLEVTES